MPDVAVNQRGSARGAVLEHFGVDANAQLGAGDFSRVYALDDARALRIFLSPPSRASLRRQARFYASLDRAAVDFKVPEVLEIGAWSGQAYIVERRLPGVRLARFLSGASDEARLAALNSYVDAVTQLPRLLPATPWFGEGLRDRPIRSQSWSSGLRRIARRELRRAGPAIRSQTPGLQRAFLAFETQLHALPQTIVPQLVHGDLHVNNVLVHPNGTISAILDFDALSLMGDPALDIATTSFFMADPQRRAIIAARARGACTRFEAAERLYELYYAFLFLKLKASHPDVHAACLRVIAANAA
jgi:aminoglycoside phosphotransferase (APT) family kinase protein